MWEKTLKIPKIRIVVSNKTDSTHKIQRVNTNEPTATLINSLEPKPKYVGPTLQPKIRAVRKQEEGDQPQIKNTFIKQRQNSNDNRQREQQSNERCEIQKICRMKQFSSTKNQEIDPRDQKVSLPFESRCYSSLLKNNFSDSIEPFKEELRDWLVDLIEISISIGFNHLTKGTLTEKETKNFVAKNILQNIKQVFQLYNEFPLEHRFGLIKFINQETYHIFDHIAYKYPQTTSKGVSRKIKSRIEVVDNRDSDQFDFLLRSGINIEYRKDGNYAKDIMKVINKLIVFSSEVYDQQMELQETNFEIFSEMIEFIFESPLNQSANITAQEIKRIMNNKKNKIQKKMTTMMDFDFGGDEKDNDIQKISNASKFVHPEKVSHKQILIGQKIPAEVPIFSEEDIEAENFKSFHSSVLRLLTKWAEELRNKVINAEDTIFKRWTKFKNNRGRLINLQPAMKKHLYDAAVKEISNIEEYINQLKEENYYLQSLFAQQEIKGKYSKNDTKVGVFAAKLNEIAGQYIFKYINRLIHSLLTIPRLAAQYASSDRQKAVLRSIDLVTFKIGDLMRCKCSCSEQQFLNILNVVDSIHTNYPNLLKIVRIKNRLESQNNDILVNFLFGGKAECQMQLSVLTADKKDEKNSYKFSHFIYQVVRAELGPISQLATIVVQYDPLAYRYSKSKHYGPQLLHKKEKEKSSSKIELKIHERNNFIKNTKLGVNIELPFVCTICKKLAIVHNSCFYYRDLNENSRVCNDCLVDSYKAEGADSLMLKKYIFSLNFQDENDKTFCLNHLNFWNTDQFISQLEMQTEEQVSCKWFPAKGYIMKKNQTKPIIELFTSMFEPTYSLVIFASKDEKDELKLLSVIKIHEQKLKKINNIKKQLKKFVIFEIQNVNQIQEDGIRFFKCNKPGCCGLKMDPGPILRRAEMQEKIHENIINQAIEQQKSLLYFDFMPNSLDKLEKNISKIQEINKFWKFTSTVQIIECFSCQLNTIRIVGLFPQLMDLNIEQNPQIKSLMGIEPCLNLKYLNCSKCDLQSIQQLKNLKKLETLNLNNNSRLQDISSLSEHTELLDLFIRKTQICSLQPLSNCLKLQSLDLQGCRNIISIKQVNSSSLSYINIIDCVGLESFDISQSSIKSLKTIEINKNEGINSILSLTTDFALTSTQRRKNRKKEQNKINAETIEKINQLLDNVKKKGSTLDYE